MAKKLKVGIIGLGWPGREHLKGYKQCGNVEVVALCDMNAELARAQADERVKKEEVLALGDIRTWG